MLITIMLVACLAGSLFTPGSLLIHLKSEVARQDRGTNIYIAKSETGIDPERCEAIGAASGVKGAGWLLYRGEAQIVPGVISPDVDISAGLAWLLTGNDSEGTLLGSGVAQKLAMSESDSSIMRRRGERTERFEGSRLVTRVHTQPVDECWADFADGGFEGGRATIETALLAAAPDTQISTLHFAAGPQTFNKRAYSAAAILSGLVLGMAGALAVRIRRIDVALYRILGFSRPSAALIVASEILAIALGTITVGLAIAITAMATAGPVPRPVVVALGFLGAAQVVGSAAAIGIASLWAAAGVDLLPVLRGGE